MAAPQASSRLELLQARFQQKQLQEKEQKLLQLYDQQQQRAYQVVQRGSAGSNGSSYGSSVSQHTVTKTSSNSHTTSTSQGGKVRQMFDERRQTTVKGIDRSYPLEPLENKPRKQTNGNVQKNGNSSVNRHSVTVKRVARADVNSNLNAGKPIVSYHEEITRESFGPPSGRRHPDDDEFGNENHVSQYANGNHRDEIQIEEVLDEDTIERNRMMAKLHLMEYDETLKHRIKNDLESEEFPEDFMVDVPDKLPKQSLSKKLSQAEARLERFRNANAKRISNATKNTSSSQVPKKRAEPGLPGKPSSSKGKTRNASERLEEMLSSSDSERTARRRDYYQESERSRTYRIDSKGQFARLSSDSSRNGRFRRRSPTFFCKEPEESATTCAIDSKTRVGAKAPRRLSPDFPSDRSRSGSPRFFCKESEKSATTYAIDPKTTRRLSDLSSDRSRSGSPRFFGRESEKSATTYAIDSKAMARSSPDFSKDVRSRSGSPKFFCKESEKSATTYAIDSKPGLGSKTTARSSPDYLKDKRSRSGSPRFFGKESEKSATTYAIDSKAMARSSPDFSKDVKSRSGSPKFLCKESEKSATTYAIDSRPGSKTTARSSPDYLKDKRSRSGSPRFFGKESEKSATTYTIDSKVMARSSPDFSKDVRSRSGSPKFFCKESEKSATTYAIDSRPGSKTTARSSPDYLKDKRSRNGSPRFFGKGSEKSATTYAIDSKAMARSSPDYLKDRRSRSGSHKFFCKESEKSATTYAIDAKTGLGSKTSRRLSPDFSSDRSQSGSPRFFCKESEKSATTYAIDPKVGLGLKASGRSSPDFSKDRRSQSGSPKFFCKESDESATTYAIDSKSKKKLASDLSKNRFVVKIEPDSELINKNSRKSPVTTDDTVDKYIKDHNLDRVRTPSPTGSLKNYTSRVKIDGEIDSKSTRTVSTNIFDTLTRDRSSSPQFLHPGSRKSPISVTSTKRRDFVSKSPDKIHNVLRDHAKMSPRKHDVSRPRATSKSPDFAKTLRKSNASPQYFSDRSATIMFVTPETITKTKAGYSKPVKKARSPTLLISKVEVANGMIDARRKKSVENIDESSKQRIRSSVSRYFEQCGTAARSEEARARDSVQKSRGAGNADACRVSSPVSLKHMEPVSPVHKSPQLYREAPGKFIATSVDRSRSGTPEFFCYETDKMATTVSLKPRPGTSPEPVRSESRLSKSSDVYATIKNVDDSSRSSSPSGTRYMTDKDKRILRIFPSNSEQPKCLRHSKSPLSTNKFTLPKGKSSKNFDVFNINKDRKPVSRRSTPSGSPEFFCYETDKMATTVSLKPRPSEDSRDYSRSPEPSRPESRLSKSPEISIKNINTSRSSSPVLSQYLTDSRASPGLFSSKNDRPGSSKDLLRKHTKSPLSTSTFPKLSKNSDVFKTNKDRKPVSRRSTPSGSPEFFCYETDKMATTVSLKPRPSKDSRVYSRSPEPSRPEIRLSKSPEISIKNINTSRSSSPVLSQYLTDSRASPEFFSSKNDRPNSPKDLPRKHSKSSCPSTYSKGKSPRNSHVFDLPKGTKSNSRSHSSRSPDFCCYETEKSVSLRASSKTSRSSGHADTLSKGGSSKSPEQSTRDPKGRRGSGNVLRSTRLIRDIIKHQGNRENACAPWRDSGVSDRKERASSVGDVGLKQRSKTGSSRSIVDRPTTPTTSSRRKLPDESSPKSGTSAEMISEIQEMTDQYAKPDRFQSRGTYSKSSKASSSSRRSDTFTSSLTKQARNRRPPLDSAIFSSSKRDRSSVGSRREMDSCSEKTTRSCNSNESVFKRRTMEDPADLASLSNSSLRSEVQTASLSRQPPTLGSIELVRKVMESGTRAPGKTLETQEADEQEGTQRRPSNSVSGTAAVNDGRSSSTNYERTDSVESALRRFDSIDTEAGVESVRVTLQESVTEKRQTLEESRVEGSANDSGTISLKALDQDANSSEAEQSATRSKRTTGTPVTSKASKKEEERRRKKITKITDSSEITGRVRPLTCRRRLFQDNDVEAGSLRKIGARSETTGPAKSDSKKANRPSTGASDSDLSLSVKRLRSIEGIRKSFGDISSDREAARAKAAIAGSASRDRSGRPRVSSSVACDRIGKESLAKRSENVGASRDSERFVKSATRFSRVQKSPSLDSTKVVETNSRTRRSVLSPSKSPDMVTRRPSTELKASDARSTKRTTPTKDAEPIGSRKTTTTTTTTRKSTDAVDGATILENGLHLQDQTVETKYDNEPQTAKKTFVIDYEEQPPKENNGPLPRKPLLKKPSIEKQTPSTPMQASTSNPKSKMTMRAKTTNLSSSSSRSSATSKTGSNCTPDLLVPCKICGRSFAQDRVTLHEQICAKTGQKRRKLFDSVMSRVKGTELEKFVKKGCAKKQPEKPPETKSNWRRKHEDFINAIRSAKQVQAHLAAGGKLSDLPPPPPSDTSDYIQCPHCGRKFNKSAAERHIPKCEHMLHNKPVHSRAPKPRR